MPQCMVYITVPAGIVTVRAGMITYPGWSVMWRERRGADKVKAREKLSYKMVFQGISYQAGPIMPQVLYKQE